MGFAVLFASAAACSLVAGLGPEPGPLPQTADASNLEAAAPDVTQTPDGADAPSGPAAMIGPCRIYPPDNPWNRDVSNDPVDTAAMTSIFPNMALTAPVHPDWGSTDPTTGAGIPFTVSQSAPVPVTPSDVVDSDPLACATGGGQFCYPIPPTAKLEMSPFFHLLLLDTTGAPNDCTLYELSKAVKDTGDNGWSAGIGVIFHLGTNALRADGRVSCDVAGLPILAGLVRYDELTSGAITHAVRLTMRNTFQGYIHPATHANGSTTAGLPPMGLRVRLKSTFNLDAAPSSPFTPVVLAGLKKYGAILADIGSDWYITGESNPGFSTPIMDSLVADLRGVHGGDFEIVQSGTVQTNGL